MFRRVSVVGGWSCFFVAIKGDQENGGSSNPCQTFRARLELRLGVALGCRGCRPMHDCQSQLVLAAVESGPLSDDRAQDEGLSRFGRSAHGYCAIRPQARRFTPARNCDVPGQTSNLMPRDAYSSGTTLRWEPSTVRTSSSSRSITTSRLTSHTWMSNTRRRPLAFTLKTTSGCELTSRWSAACAWIGTILWGRT